ncbi:MAG: hypothetical protein Sv326_0260 [Candidatus Fermentimicrarchaeum limneticum]|uniref:Pilus assembly protein n=1 Tax=Fermentimicrarchaeum limneticum TaxID=2795018 RepID=A0A7D6BGE1_FERL1|nr:MAG: hypothetical protein Sv326_0260 [Candidatus Fermentimicrarchaeum limneticum]
MLETGKGQIGIEYAAVLVLFLFILVPVLYIGMMDIQIAGQTSQARVAVDSIADSADRVYAQGPGATTTVEIYLPAGINSASFNKQEVNINLNLPTGGKTDVYALARGNLSGTMPTLPGRHVLVVRMNSSGQVQIAEVT